MQINDSSHADRASSDHDHEWRTYGPVRQHSAGVDFTPQSWIYEFGYKIIRKIISSFLFFFDMQIHKSSHAERASSDQDHEGRSYPHLSSFVTCRLTTAAILTVVPVIRIIREDHNLTYILLWHAYQRQQPCWPCLQWSGSRVKTISSFIFFCDMQINNSSHTDRGSSDQDHL